MTPKIGYQKLKEIKQHTIPNMSNAYVYQYAVSKFSELPFEEQWKQIEKVKGILNERK